MMDEILAFHQSGRRCVLSVTGGGTGLVAQLLGVPGGSASVLEAVVPYGADALKSWLKRTPDSACSAETALAMAAAAHHRAVLLNDGWSDDLVGLGMTAALISSRPKRGEHRVHVAVQTARQTVLTSVVLEKDARSRESEEHVAAQVGVRTLFAAVGLTGSEIALTNRDRIETHAAVSQPEWTVLRAGAQPVIGMSKRHASPVGLLSGSFAPKHQGHDSLRDAASEWLGGPVFFEMPIVNADKPPLDDMTLRGRLAQFDEWPLLTRLPTFVEKARQFSETTFVVGMDTAVRILDARFYEREPVENVLAEIRDHGCRFLVAARHDEGVVATRDQLAVPRGFDELFEALPVEQFLEEVSSTELRRRTSWSAVGGEGGTSIG